MSTRMFMKKTFPMSLLIMACSFVLTPNGNCIANTTTNTFRPSLVAGIEDSDRDGFADGFYSWSTIDSDYYIEQTPSREIRNIIEFDLRPYLGTTIVDAVLTMRIYANNGYGAQYREYDIILYDGDGLANLTDFSSNGTLLTTLGYTIGSGGAIADLDITAYVQTLLDNSVPFLGIRTDPITEGDYGTTVGHYQQYFDNELTLTVKTIPAPSSLLLAGLGVILLKKRRNKWILGMV